MTTPAVATAAAAPNAYCMFCNRHYATYTLARPAVCCSSCLQPFLLSGIMLLPCVRISRRIARPYRSCTALPLPLAFICLSPPPFMHDACHCPCRAFNTAPRLPQRAGACRRTRAAAGLANNAVATRELSPAINSMGAAPK